MPSIFVKEEPNPWTYSKNSSRLLIVYGILVIYNLSGNLGNAVILRTRQSVEMKITFIAT